jgi:hypothetical protein
MKLPLADLAAFHPLSEQFYLAASAPCSGLRYESELGVFSLIEDIL